MYKLRFETYRITSHCKPRVNRVNPELLFLHVGGERNDAPHRLQKHQVGGGGGAVKDIH